MKLTTLSTSALALACLISAAPAVKNQEQSLESSTNNSSSTLLGVTSVDTLPQNPTVTATVSDQPCISRREQDLKIKRKGKKMWTKTMTAGTSVYRTFWKNKSGKWTGKTTRTVVFTDPLPWASTTWSTLEHTMWVSKHAPAFTWFKTLPNAFSTASTPQDSAMPILLQRDPRAKDSLKTSTITFGTSRYVQTYLFGDYSTTETQLRTFTDPLPWSATLQRTVTLTMEVPVPAKTHAHAEANNAPIGAVSSSLIEHKVSKIAKSSLLQRRGPKAAMHEMSNRSVTKSILVTTTFVEKVPWPRTESSVFPRSKLTTTFIEEIPVNKPYPVVTSIILEMPWPPTSRALKSTSKDHWWNHLWPHKPATPSSSHSKLDGVAHQIATITNIHSATRNSFATKSAVISKIANSAYSASTARSGLDARTLVL